ncbi:MAG: hypothetical protein WA949_19180 [Phormidesmis sp.]
MTPKQALIQEIEDAPMPLINEVLSFLRFLKSKQPPVDFMEFAGMAADIPDIIDEIVEDAERNRQLDLQRNR